MIKANISHINTRLSLLLVTFLLLPAVAMAGNVIIETPLGNIELEMLDEDAPNTVANFLYYINEGNYENTFIHRVEPGFVIQGGGWVFDDGATQVKTISPIQNEYKVSNTRGTVAMAKFENSPNSATSQWFINLKDNTHLDSQNGGFTVFARVVSGMEVADAIDALELISGGPSFPSLPVINFTAGETIVAENLVMTTLTELDAPPKPFAINAGLNDSWFDPETNGQGFFISVYPALGSVAAAWFTYDTELPAGDATANLGDPGQRWMTLQGPIDGNTSEMTIYNASGGLFDDGTPITNTAIGTATLTFENCNSGTVVYDIPSVNRQGTIPIERVAIDNVELCETIQDAE